MINIFLKNDGGPEFLQDDFDFLNDSEQLNEMIKN